MVEAYAQLQEAMQLMQDMLAGQAGFELFDAACDALNVAAIKLRFIQLELADREENPPGLDITEDDTLPPDETTT
jgi:hypothetical protein